MDNFFTSFCLLKFLASNNIRASGRVRENWLGHCIITKKITNQCMLHQIMIQLHDDKDAQTKIAVP